MLGSEILGNCLHPRRRLLEPVALANPLWLRHRALIAGRDGEERERLITIRESIGGALIHGGVWQRVSSAWLTMNESSLAESVCAGRPTDRRQGALGKGEMEASGSWRA
jgi:hypothetical protein